MFSNNSNLVEGVDTAFVVILAIIIFFLIGLTITLIYFIYKYNEKRNPKPTQIKGNNKLEVIWTVIPLILVMVMFYFGWIGWKPMYSKAPKDALKIKTTARMWSWNFEYPNGKSLDTLIIPQGKPVNLDLISPDVIHSIYIPAFRFKQDMIPGQKIERWFIGNSPGSYDLFCAEYCGLRHSYMYTSVKVLPPDEFEKWYKDTTGVIPASEMTPELAGKKTMRDLGCFACHSLDGTKLVGPSYKGLYGSNRKVIVNGKETEVIADDEYLINSIYNPNDELVEGYNKGLMQSYQGQISEEEMAGIIEYIKSIK